MILLPLMFSAAIAGSQADALSVGQPARLFTLPALNEEAAMEIVNKAQVSLSDFTGVDPLRPSRGVVVHFFNRESGGANLPTLNRVARRYDNRDIQVLAVSVDSGDLGGLSTWVGGLRLDYPVLRDNHRVVFNRFGVSELPLTVVIDGDGRVYAIGKPDGTELEESIGAELDGLLAR